MSDSAKVLSARPLTAAELRLLCWIFEDDKGALKQMYPAMYERLVTLRAYESANE